MLRLPGFISISFPCGIKAVSIGYPRLSKDVLLIFSDFERGTILSVLSVFGSQGRRQLGTEMHRGSSSFERRTTDRWCSCRLHN